MSDEGIDKQIPAIKRGPGNPAWVKGVSGNPKGPPPNPEAEELRQAIRIAKKKNGNRSILVHFVERAYFNDNVLIALVKKLIPDKIHKDISLDEDLAKIVGDRVQINFIGVTPNDPQRGNCPEVLRGVE